MLRVLAYHRVAELEDTPTVDPRSVSATPSAFAAQMRHVTRYYRAVSMPEVLDAVERKRRLPERSVLITFDDAYSDFVENAWPILRRFQLPVTVFVPTAYPGYPGRAFWWDRLYHAFANTPQTALYATPLGPLPVATPDQRRRSLRALQDYLTTISHDETMVWVDRVCAELGATTCCGSVLSWERLRELARDGVTLGSHTRTHTIMTQLSTDRIREEVTGSQRDLTREIGVALPVFCYPNGNHNDAVATVLRNEGILTAFTTLPEKNELGSANLLRLGRTCITPRTTLPIFCLRLLRPGVYLDQWRHRKSKQLSLQRLVLSQTPPSERAA